MSLFLQEVSECGFLAKAALRIVAPKEKLARFATHLNERIAAKQLSFKA